MELSERLLTRIKEYLRSQEFLWTGAEMFEYRDWYRMNIGGEFGTSPQCWRDAIMKAVNKFNITI